MLTDTSLRLSQTSHVRRHHRLTFGKEMTGFHGRLRRVASPCEAEGVEMDLKGKRSTATRAQMEKEK